MSLILSIETAAAGCSVALHHNGELVEKAKASTERAAAEELTTLIGECLTRTGVWFESLAALAVSKGPGSYTGLRIGVSTAKGICYATDLPLIAVNALDIMIAEASQNKADAYCPMLDARRMEVYCKIISKETELLPTSALVVSSDSFQEILDIKQTLFFGSGAIKCKAVLNHPNASFSDSIPSPNAEFMGKLAFEKFKKGDFEDLMAFEPFYLKEFMITTPKK